MLILSNFVFFFIFMLYFNFRSVLHDYYISIFYCILYCIYCAYVLRLCGKLTLQ